MINIDNKQYRMLQKIKHCGTLTTEGLTDEQYEIIEYLKSHNFIKTNEKSVPMEYHDYYIGSKNVITDCRITQDGRAQIYAFKFKYHFWWIPIVVSIASSAISILISAII